MMTESSNKRYSYKKIDSLESFVASHQVEANGTKEVFFCNILGTHPDMERRFRTMENQMQEAVRQGKIYYYRLSEFPKIMAQNDVAVYEKVLLSCQNKESVIMFPHFTAKGQFALAIEEGLLKVKDCFRRERSAVTDTIVKNFEMKVLYWLDVVGKFLFDKDSELKDCKLVVENVTKEQEFYFCLFMTLLGCDVLLLQSEKDAVAPESVMAYLQTIEKYPFGKGTLPKYVPIEPRRETSNVRTVEDAPPIQEYKIDLSRREPKAKADYQRREKSFEELALLASSIVMISVYDEDGEVHKTGSGIMIGSDGFILTNFHVIAGGRVFAVRIEDDERTYETSDIIKYNPNLDLAVIRIYRKLKPLPIYQGKTKLVRGQKVVAIGSPLGLFNSVSDGIISGFRNIRNEDMIQFTAPISHGSSGGAVLNMYGEVIGISTAGIDEGQNINLAMGYESILGFAQGFFDK